MPIPIAALLLFPLLQTAGTDPRKDYDVQLYRLDLRVQPEEKKLSGRVGVEFRVVADSMSTLVLDIGKDLKEEGAWLVNGSVEDGWKGKKLSMSRKAGLLSIELGKRAKKG